MCSQSALLEVPQATPPPGRRPNWIADLVGALTDPIIVWPGPWQADLPEKLKSQVTIERLLALQNDEKLATWSETALYLFPRSMEAPMGTDWTDIYLHACARAMDGPEYTEQNRRDAAELDRGLNDYQQDLLRHLRRWIYEKKVAARPREPRPAAPAPEPEIKAEQFELFG